MRYGTLAAFTSEDSHFSGDYKILFHLRPMFLLVTKACLFQLYIHYSNESQRHLLMNVKKFKYGLT